MASNVSCWDCFYFKSKGLSCPKHGTPEERAATDAKVLASLTAFARKANS